MTEPRVGFDTLRDYFKFMKPDSLRFSTLIAITVATSVAPLLNPLIFRQIVDGAIAHSNVRLLMILSALSLGLVAVTIGLTYCKEIVTVGLLQRQIKRLRMRTYDAYSRRSLDSMAAVPSGEPVALVSHGANEAASLATTIGPRILQTISVVVGAGGVLVSVGMPIWLLLPMIGILPLTLISQYVARRIEHLMSESIDALGAINTHVSETTSPGGALLLRSGTNIAYDRGRFGQKLTNYAKKILRQTRWHSSFGVLVGAYGGLAVSVLFFAGGFLAIRGEMSTGDVVALATVSPMVISPLIGSTGIRTEAARSLMAFARILNADQNGRGLSLGSRCLDSDTSAPAADPSQPVIAARNVSKNYDSSDRGVVLEDVNLDICRGERLAIQGESGAGKSTLLRILAGVDTSFTGSVLIDGVTSDLLNDAERKNLALYVGQETFLIRDSVMENFRLFKPDIAPDEVWGALDQVGMAEVVSQMPEGLDTVLGAEKGGLSGGQTARIGIARALAANPDVIFLDEPFAHLDRGTGRRVLGAILEQINTVVLVTHQDGYAHQFPRWVDVAAGRASEVLHER